MAREVSAVRKEVDSDVSVVGILRGRADAQNSGQRLVSVTDIEMGGDYSVGMQVYCSITRRVSYIRPIAQALRLRLIVMVKTGGRSGIALCHTSGT